MRVDAPEFQSANEAGTRTPRFVVGIIYTTASPHFTSHAGLTNVPGNVVQNVVEGVSGFSQELFPDEGRSTIGSIDFRLVDAAGAVTAELKTKLAGGEGVRHRTVRIYMGFSDDFTAPDWRLLHTYIIENVTPQRGGYAVRCADISREFQQVIFEQKQTRLSASISDTATTIPVADTSGFETVFHPNSFTDAPGSTVGYLLIEKTKEIVRYTGVSASPAQFTGCTRGALNTTALPMTLSGTEQADQRPKILEFIYLEAPGPMLQYAIQTGIWLGTSPALTLPDHWHLGVATSFVRLADYENIGEDLYDPTDETAGFVLRFTHLKRQDGRRFLEREINLLQSTFSPIYSTGEVGLRRMTRVLSDAVGDILFEPDNLVDFGDPVLDQTKVINQVSIDWNHNGAEFTRRNVFLDATSISRHGTAPEIRLEFRGLHGVRHTALTLRQVWDRIRDRYAAPPMMMDFESLPSLNRLEVGDIAQTSIPQIRDYTSEDSPPILARAFELQRVQPNYITGEFRVSGFASSEDIQPEASTADDPVLPNGFYTQAGIDLDSLAQVSGGAITSNLTLSGGADMNASGSIWYHNGNLTLNVGVTLTLEENVQLRILGFFTVNGTIDGVAGRVGSGQSDPSTLGSAYAEATPLPGYIGHVTADNSLQLINAGGQNNSFQNWRAQHSVRRRQSFPVLNLEIETTGSPAVTTIKGIPTDIRGAPGPHGAAVVDAIGAPPITNEGLGGTGADGGAGLYVVSRGMGFGVSAGIDLSGGNSTGPAFVTINSIQVFPGAGAGGGAGAFLILLDGGALTIPDLSGVFVSANGITDDQGARASGGGTYLRWPDNSQPLGGFALPPTSGKDFSNSAVRIQYLAIETTAQEDQDTKPNAPTSLSISDGVSHILAQWDVVGLGADETTEVFAAVPTNDRTGATKVAEQVGDTAVVTVADTRDRFFWVRRRNTVTGELGDFFPASSTAGIQGNATSVEDSLSRYIPDPNFNNQSGWDELPAASNTITYITGTESTGAFQLDHDAEGGGSLRVLARRTSPGNVDPTVVENDFFRVSFRWRATIIAGAQDPIPITISALIRDTAFDLSGEFGNGKTMLQAVSLPRADIGLWQESTIMVGILNSGRSPAMAPPRYAQIQINFPFGPNQSDSPFVAGDQYEIDYCTAELLSEVFSVDKPGLVPDPVSVSGLFLKDDGTFAAPSGVGEINLGANVGSGADIFRDKTGVTLNLRGVNPINGMTAAVSGDNVNIGIAADGVTFARMQNIATDRLIGRDTAGSGDPEEIQVAGGIEFGGSGAIRRQALTGDVTAAAGGNATTIANNAVTNAKAADMSTLTIKGRIAAGGGNPQDLTALQARQVLDVDPKNSIVIDTGQIQLVGDAAAPGAGRYYGTDESSPPAKGFFVLPTGGGGPTITQNVTRLRHENSTAQTSIFSDSSPDGISIPAIAVGEIARIEIYGQVFNNSAAARTVQWVMTLGGTTFYDQGTATLRQTWVASTLRRPMRLTIEIANRSATEALVNMFGQIAGPTNFPTTGRGAFRRYTEGGADRYAGVMESAGGVSIDMTTARILDILITFPVANANLEITRESYEIRTP